MKFIGRKIIKWERSENDMNDSLNAEMSLRAR